MLSLEKGQLGNALSELESLRQMADHLSPAMRNDVEYSYGIALMKLERASEALPVLISLRSNKGFGAAHFQLAAVSIEIATAYFMCSEPHEALREIDLVLEPGNLDSLSTGGSVAYILRGQVLMQLERFIDAERDLRKAMRIACSRHDPEFAGIAAEHLARLLLTILRVREAKEWAILAKRAFQEHTAHHRRTFQDLEWVTEPSYAAAVPLEASPELELLSRMLDSFKSTKSQDRLSIFDLDLFAFLKATRAPERPVWIDIPLYKEVLTSQTLSTIFIDELKAAIIEDDYAKVIEGTFLAQLLHVTSRELPPSNTLADGSFEIIEKEEEAKGFRRFHWGSNYAWPWGFRRILDDLGTLYQVGWLFIKRKTADLSAQAKAKGVAISEDKISFLANTTRVLARSLRSRYWGMGEFDTGAVPSPPHLAEEVARPVLNNRGLSVSRYRAMGFSEAEATELTDSGLLPITINDLHVVDRDFAPDVVGGMIIDEFSQENPPSKRILDMNPETVRPGWFIDSHYHCVFWARELHKFAFYGQKSISRKHFDTFHKSLAPTDSLRCKQWTVPVIEASSTHGLKEIADRIRDLRGDRCYYRGQSQQYPLQRSEAVKRLLFGRIDIVEPSIPGTAPRLGLDFNTIFPLLQLMLQDYMYQQSLEQQVPIETAHREWTHLGETKGNRHSWEAWERGVMAFAQHYGLPTHGLDITRSLEVAIWFATHKLRMEADGKYRYEGMSADDWPSDPARYPVVYFILPVTHSIRPSIARIPSLSSIGLAALRPERQEAEFFMGADSIHQNRIAEALVCAVRLRPGDWETGLSYEYLFPDENEDPGYACMLALRRRFCDGARKAYFGRILEFAYGKHSESVSAPDRRC